MVWTPGPSLASACLLASRCRSPGPRCPTPPPSRSNSKVGRRHSKEAVPFLGLVCVRVCARARACLRSHVCLCVHRTASAHKHTGRQEDTRVYIQGRSHSRCPRRPATDKDHFLARSPGLGKGALPAIMGNSSSNKLHHHQQQSSRSSSSSSKPMEM